MSGIFGKALRILICLTPAAHTLFVRKQRWIIFGALIWHLDGDQVDAKGISARFYERGEESAFYLGALI